MIDFWSSEGYMKIKLLKTFDKDEIVDMPDFFAKSLIKRGKACTLDTVYHVFNLCCVNIGTVEGYRVIRRFEGGFPDDMAIYFQPKRIAICTYNRPLFKKSMYVEGDYYTHVADNKTYISDSSQLNSKIRRGETIVDSSSAKLLIDCYEDAIQECGFGGKYFYTPAEISELEDKINEKNKYFLLGQRSIRSKYHDPAIDLFNSKEISTEPYNTFDFW